MPRSFSLLSRQPARRVALAVASGALLLATALAPVASVGAGTTDVRDSMTGLVGVPRGWTLRLAAVNSLTGAAAPTCRVSFQVRSATGARLAGATYDVLPGRARFFDFRPTTGFGGDDRLEAYGMIINGSPDPNQQPCASALVPSAEAYDGSNGIGETFIIIDM